MVARLKRAIALLLVILVMGLASCGGNREEPTVLLDLDAPRASDNFLVGTLSEVSPPAIVQQLKPFLDVYTPQVRIVSPRDHDVIADTRVTVELQVKDLPIYKDAELELGPHLHVLLDDQPYQSLYDSETSIVFADLAPGTHTVRAFAVRPWDESFKNAEAYDQVTFDVFTNSEQNNPDNGRTLLTYNQPQGHYGAEPIMLDFYLTNAPLHMVAENDETILDWRIRCTVNGKAFVFDRWQPIYLKGFKSGKNWVKLEAIDENGTLIENAFNTAIQLIDYEPGANDSLARLIRGDIPLEQAKVLVDPSYEYPVSADAEETAEEVESEAAESETVEAIAPSAEEPTQKLDTPSPFPTPETPEQAQRPAEDTVVEDTTAAEPEPENLPEVDSSVAEPMTEPSATDSADIPATPTKSPNLEAESGQETRESIPEMMPEELNASPTIITEESASIDVDSNADEPTPLNDEATERSEPSPSVPVTPDTSLTTETDASQPTSGSEADEATTEDDALSTVSKAEDEPLDAENLEVPPEAESSAPSESPEANLNII